MADNDNSAWSSYLSKVSDWFADPKNDVSKYLGDAPQLQHYPTPQEATEGQGVSYGTGNESFDSGNVAKIFGLQDPPYFKMVKGKPTPVGPGQFVPTASTDLGLDTSQITDFADAHNKLMDLTDPKNKPIADRVGKAFGQAQLAAVHNPIAAVGYDPHSIVMDAVTGPTNIEGVTYGKSIWTNLEDPSTIIHESTHRGLNILSETYPEAKQILQKVNQEPMVRYLMATRAGDPEKEGGNIDKKQRQDAITKYTTDFSAKGRQADLKRLEELAQDYIKNQRTQGPK